MNPPLLCIITSCYDQSFDDKSEPDHGEILIWNGIIQVRCDPDKDDLWQLESKGRKLWCETSCLEVIGRPNGPHYATEALREFGASIFTVEEYKP